MVIFLIAVTIVISFFTGMLLYQIKNSRTSGRVKASKITCPPKPKKLQNKAFQRLTIKAIIRWEQMKGKSFSLIDFADPEEVKALLYAMYVIQSRPMYTFDVFQSVLEDEQFMTFISTDLARAMAVVAQFQKKTESTGSSDVTVTPETIGNIVSTLIMSGLDAHYVLNEMELCDMSLFIAAYERKRKEEMESSRLWTYLTMLPHIDATKLKNGAKDLITFPWEHEEVDTEIKESEIERFEAFMEKGKNFIIN